LLQVLESVHADVRVRAACALARLGHADAIAPLLKLATAPEPAQAERVAEWSALVEQALGGLAELGVPATLEILPGLLASKHDTHRKLAARALAFSSRPDLPESVDQLRTALMHDDPQVKYQAALGLAFVGDASVTALVFSEQAKAVLRPEDRLVAALALGPAGDDYLALFLDDADESLRNQALVLLMLLEM